MKCNGTAAGDDKPLYSKFLGTRKPSGRRFQRGTTESIALGLAMVYPMPTNMKGVAAEASTRTTRILFWKEGG